MGLLDAILGGMMGGQGQSAGGPGMGAQGQNPLLQIVLQLLTQNGGLQGADRYGPNSASQSASP